MQASASVTVVGPSQVRLGGSAQYSVLVDGTAVPAAWSVNGVAGGHPATGSISTAGVYVPALTIWAGHSVIITATLTSNSELSTSVSVKVLNPLPVFGYASATQAQQSGQYSLDVHGSGFVPGSELQVAGENLLPTFVSSSELQSSVNLSGGTTVIVVGIVNPNAGQKSPVTGRVSIQPATHEVVLSWEASVSAMSSLIGYNTYRSTGGGSPYQLLNQSPNPQLTFVDSSVQSGSTYNYFVTSIDSSGAESSPSNEVVATIP